MAKALIELEAAHLLVGESANRLECPFCASLDRSFSVTRTETGVLYNCYRDSCRQKSRSSGFLGTTGVHTWGNTKAAPRKGSPFLGDLEPLEQHHYNQLFQSYYLKQGTLDSCGVMVDPRGRRYMVPVRNPDTYTRGWVARAAPGATLEPKAISYQDNPDKPWLGWYRPALKGQPIKGAILVEDHWSAMRISQDCPEWTAIALMGTHLSYEAAREIGLTSPSKVVIALDKDATQTAFKMQKKYALMFSCPTQALPLGMDFKDMAGGFPAIMLGALS